MLSVEAEHENPHPIIVLLILALNAFLFVRKVYCSLFLQFTGGKALYIIIYLQQEKLYTYLVLKEQSTKDFVRMVLFCFV